MTAKEIAFEIYHKYRTLEGKFGDKVMYNHDAKQCSDIAVDYLIHSHSQDTTDNQFYWWQEVKQELEKL